MPTSRTLAEWIEVYEKKTGDKFSVPKGYGLSYLAERGFAQMRLDYKTKMIVIYQVCGDGKFWRDYAELYAAGIGFECVATMCTRSIKPYIRAFGWKIEREYHCISSESNPGKVESRYLCRDGLGRPIVITLCGYEDDGREDYWVTHYLNTKEAPKLEVNPDAFIINSNFEKGGDDSVASDFTASQKGQ
jgi:hypothetical protein|nr:MAG TPA: hypothetical protein [Caudoviricetes sp.]